ncbi:MAG: hypothetical protein ACXVCX_04695, partial [Ktedonobacterales bacterium]
MSKNSLIPDEDSVSLRVHDTPESSSGGVAFMAPNQKVMMQATGASTIEQGPLTTRGLSVILPAYNEEAV